MKEEHTEFRKHIAIQHQKNIEKWGLQSRETILLAMQEELGELTQAFLEGRTKGVDDLSLQYDELVDLAALMLAYNEVILAEYGEFQDG